MSYIDGARVSEPLFLPPMADAILEANTNIFYKGIEFDHSQDVAMALQLLNSTSLREMSLGGFFLPCYIFWFMVPAVVIKRAVCT
jgi:hypothetical protein